MIRKIIIYSITIILFVSLASQVYCKNNKFTKLPDKSAIKTEEICNLIWWEQFEDPALLKLLNKSINNNHDIKIADLKELEMNQWVKVSFGKELPSISIGPTFNRNLNSYNAYPEPAGNFFGGSWNTFKLPLNANYEIDLWKQNRLHTKAQVKLYETSIQDRKTAYLSITTAVASVYLNILKLDKIIQLEKEFITLNEERHKILKAKFVAGLSSNNDVLRADKNIIDAKNNLTGYKKQRSTLLNELAILTGSSPALKEEPELASIDELKIFYILKEELPSDIIMNRPDILKAELLMEESLINVSVARKEFLPKLNLSGFIGYNSIKLSNFFNWDSFITGIATGMFENLFTGGQRRARLKANKFKYEQMFQSYQKTFLIGLQELNDAIVSYKSDLELNNKSLNKINIENEDLNLIKLKYEKGLIPKLVLLDQQQGLIRLKQQQIQYKTNCLIDIISLFKATGGTL